MAQAVRVVTVDRGIDPRELALVAFGGAGPLHAAAIADELGMRRIVVPNVSGVLSALGLVVSERRRDLVESVLLAGHSLTRQAVAEVVARLGERGREDLGEPRAQLRASYDLRYAGQAFELSVEGELEPEPGELRRAFDRAHDDRYGYEDPDAELELVTVRVAAALPGAEPRPTEPVAAERRGTRTVRFGHEELEAQVLGQGRADVDGPAIFELPGATLVVPPGWSAEAGGDAVVMQRA
jgi:N-methylhydantoinase A